MNFFYLLSPLMLLQTRSSLAGDNGEYNELGVWGQSENFDFYREDYENYQLILTKIRDLRVGIQTMDLSSLFEKFFKRTLYYHGYSDDEVTKLIESEEDLVEFLMRVLAKEILIDICRGREMANPHLQSFMRNLKERYQIAADLYQEEYIRRVEDIYLRCNLDELSDYVILLKEKLYYEGFLREPDIDFKRTLKSRDDQFKYLDDYFKYFDRFTGFYRNIFSANNSTACSDVCQKIFFKLEIDQLWRLKENLTVSEKLLPYLLDSWIEASKRVIIFKLSISPQKSKVFVFKELQQLQKKLHIAAALERFSGLLQELKWIDLNLLDLIRENNIENVLRFLLEDYFSYEKFIAERMVFELGFKYLTLMGFDHSSLKMRIRQINFYLEKPVGRELKMNLFQILRDPQFRPFLGATHLDFDKTMLFYKILSKPKRYQISRNSKGAIIVYPRRLYPPILSMLQKEDVYLTTIFNAYYKEEFFSHDMRVSKEKVVETLCQMIFQRFPFSSNLE